jgi:hypothetical protein
MSDRPEKGRAWSWWYLLFVVQCGVVLWPGLYNRTEPQLIGIPFFYWSQLAWIVVAAILTGTVYFMTER